MKAKCTKCDNINEVKIATGYNKPENKGKKYFTCANCNEFQWVKDEVLEAPTTPQKATEVREAVQQDIPSFKPRDFNEEARGKIRSLFLEARTNLVGLVPITKDEFDALIELTEVAMTGQFPKSYEDVEDTDLPSEYLAKKNKEELANSPIGQTVEG